MTIFAVDSDAKALEKLTGIVSRLGIDGEVRAFHSSLEALAAARETVVDAALLEVSLPELDGLNLGLYLKEMHPMVNLIFVTKDRQKCYDALAMHASGYVLKPAGADQLRREFDDLRHPAAQQGRKRVFAQTFGNFEMFVDDRPVEFKYNRTKELVALLVNNRGAQTSNGEIIGSLWEDDGDPDRKTSYLSNLRQDLQNTFKKLQITDIIVKQRGSLGIAVNRIECDLYDWLEKKKNSKYHYLGDYMNQYSWAEYVHAELDDLSYALEDE